MKVVQGLLGVVLLAISIWAVLRIRATRQKLRVALFEAHAAVVISDIPAVLREAGFSEGIQVGTARGARGTFEGVVIQALGADELGPNGHLAVWTFGVVAPAGQRRLGVSATPQGVRRKKRSLVLGIAEVDSRLDVTGDAAAALELFGRRGAHALVNAITAQGWRLVDGMLLREALTVHGLREVANAGAAAAKVVFECAAQAAPDNPRAKSA